MRTTPPPGPGVDQEAQSGRVVLVASFNATAQHRDELRRRLLEMVELTCTEQGCLQYDLHQDIDDPLRFSFVETWVDQASLDRHDQSAHVLAMVRDAPGLTAAGIEKIRLRAI